LPGWTPRQDSYPGRREHPMVFGCGQAYQLTYGAIYYVFGGLMYEL
jgi:hypothetical protein